MSDSDTPVFTRREEGVAVVRLNRPDRLNAVNLPLYRRLVDSLETLEEDTGVRGIVLTGAGRGFCAGADVKDETRTEWSGAERRDYAEAGSRANLVLQAMRVPVVAAVNGPAVGAGLELALSCDVVVVASGARLGLPELRLGTFVGGGVTRSLLLRVGPGMTRELLLTGRLITGEEAASLGLADHAVPGERVVGEAVALAGEMAGAAPVSLRLLRELLADLPALGRKEVVRREEEALLACMDSEDWLEGTRAYREGRPPDFRGR